MDANKKALAYEMAGRVFIIFAFYTPYLQIFQDSTIGGYGVG